MKVSVIIAAYNIDKYIKRCLISIINQTLREIEIIVVNDGSKDNTLNVIEEIAINDDRIKIINQKNKGSIESRKSGLIESNGEYILFVDGDDWLEINALELLYNTARSNNSDIVMYDAYLTYDDRREKLKVIFGDNLNKNDYIENLFLDKILPCIWSKFVKRDFLIEKNIEFPSEISFAEDLAAVSSWFMNHPKVTILNEYLYNYYQRETSITKSKNIKVLEVDKAIEFIKKKLIEKNIYNKYKKEFEHLVYIHQFNWFLTYCNEEDLNIKLYEQYKKKNIKINENYILKSKINKYPISLRTRIKLYHKSYRYGRLYDKMRDLVRS